jgi:hypothetical protein
MRKLSLTLTTAALALGMTALVASAQTQHLGIANLHGQLHNATPIVKQAACRGPGRWCGPGFVRRCGFPLLPHCRCVPC